MIKKPGVVYCIKDYIELNVCIFTKGKTYNVVAENSFTVSIIDNKQKTLRFNISSPFNVYTIPNHFITLAEYRRKKLTYLNHIQK